MSHVIRLLVLFYLVLLVSGGCNLDSKSEVEAENKALVRHLFEELDKKNFDAFDKLTTPDCVIRIPTTVEPITRDKQQQIFPIFYDAFPDYHHTIDEILAEGDKVAVRLTNRGTQKKEWMDIPPKGNKIEYGAIFICRIANGKIAEVWAEEDYLSMMQQLGMELKPKKAEK